MTAVDPMERGSVATIVQTLNAAEVRYLIAGGPLDLTDIDALEAVEKEGADGDRS